MTITGTNTGDIIQGTPRADVILARGGDDSVYAGAGRDIVCSGDGDDRVYGQGGSDELLGGTERSGDELFGGAGQDTFWGDTRDDHYGMDGVRLGRAEPSVIGDTVVTGPGFDTVLHTKVRVSYADRPTAVRLGVSSPTDRVRGVEQVQGTAYDDVIVNVASIVGGAGGADHVTAEMIFDTGWAGGDDSGADVMRIPESSDGGVIISKEGPDVLIGSTARDIFEVHSGQGQVLSAPRGRDASVRDHLQVLAFADGVADMAAGEIRYADQPVRRVSGTFTVEFRQADPFTYYGSGGRDVVDSLGGTIYGRGGPDKLSGEDVFGGTGDDDLRSLRRAHGGPGDDKVWGTDIWGDDGRDTLRTDASYAWVHQIHGGRGADTVTTRVESRDVIADLTKTRWQWGVQTLPVTGIESVRVNTREGESGRVRLLGDDGPNRLIVSSARHGTSANGRGGIDVCRAGAETSCERNP